jgi:hypothetical protein
MSDEDDTLLEPLFLPLSPKKKKQPTNEVEAAQQLVQAAITRLKRATIFLPEGEYGVLRLPAYRQQDPTTCFFSGPIMVARSFLGKNIDEHVLAGKAREMGLLTDKGVSSRRDKWEAMETFIKQQTGVDIRFGYPHVLGHERDTDLQMVACIAEDGNVASVLYPVSEVDGRGEWETFYAVEKDSRGEVTWHSVFSPTGQHVTRTNQELAQTLYGVAANWLPTICAIEVQTLYSRESSPNPLFRPRNPFG